MATTAAAKRVARKRSKPNVREGRRAAPVPPESTPLPPGVLLSVNQIGEEFGHERRTVTKRITELGIQPAGQRQGYPVYRLRDVLDMERRVADGQLDPDKMTPFERQAHYKAESERLRLDLERGDVIRRDDAAAEWARVVKIIALEMDVAIDEIERDVQPPPAVLEQIERKFDSIRVQMFGRVVADPDDEAIEAVDEPRALL